jgi:hypothetical protein
LTCLDSSDDSAGEGLRRACSLKLMESLIFMSCSFTDIDPSSTFTGGSILAFFELCDSAGVDGSDSLFRLRGVWLGSAEGDFPSGD